MTYNDLVSNFALNPRDVHSVPLTGKTPVWFFVYSRDSRIYVTVAKESRPSSRISSPRRLNESEFDTMLDIYKRRKQGNPVSQEASEATNSQVYWYGIFSDLGL